MSIKVKVAHTAFVCIMFGICIVFALLGFVIGTINTDTTFSQGDCVEHVAASGSQLTVAKRGDVQTILRNDGKLLKVMTEDLVPCGAGI